MQSEAARKSLQDVQVLPPPRGTTMRPLLAQPIMASTANAWFISRDEASGSPRFCLGARGKLLYAVATVFLFGPGHV